MSSAHAGAQTFASLAGVDGVVTTLAFYDGGGAHPGTNAVDIGAPGGTAVFHPIDYLPSWISGGWIWVGPVHEAGRCSQWWPGSPYYNGDKIYVHAYLYDTNGNFVGTHRSAFQHVAPFADHMNSWWSFNNPGGSALASPMERTSPTAIRAAAVSTSAPSTPLRGRSRTAAAVGCAPPGRFSI